MRVPCGRAPRVMQEPRGKSQTDALRRMRMVGHEDVGAVEARQQIRGAETSNGKGTPCVPLPSRAYSSAAAMAGRAAVSAPDAIASASSAASTSSTGVSTSMSRCLYAVSPVPAGMSRPMITFSFRPRR
jgi:hypothetical protein